MKHISYSFVNKCYLKNRYKIANNKKCSQFLQVEVNTESDLLQKCSIFRYHLLKFQDRI